MPNPYHDENGRFCSRGEMNAAVDRLIKNEQWNDAQRLARELTTITEVNKREKNLTELSDEKQSQINDVANRIAYSNQRMESAAHRSLAFDGLSDEDVEHVGDKLLVLTHAHYNAEYKEALEEEEQFTGKLKEAFGTANLTSVERKLGQERNLLELDGKNLLNKIKIEAVSNGFPSSKANFYFSEQRTLLGYADTFSSPYKEFKKAQTPSALNADILKPKIRDVANRAILAAAVEKVLAENKNDVEAFNTQATAFSTDSKKLADIRRTHDPVKIAREKSRQAAYEESVSTVQSQIEWREQVREVGLRTNNLNGVALSTIRPNTVLVNEDNEVTNIWVRQGEQVDRITGYGSNDEQSYLVGESGIVYKASTHYANYSSSRQDHTVIVDETQTGTPANLSLGFNKITDSGD